ncbi:MAG: hypothetical protein HY248_01010, partial [Fimbriimonas ginsengisoli]|nr:hypothetical protein [Fimbriimonas ginsengisoli]
VKAEGVEVEPAALSAIARIADGGYRDALTLLEQALLVSDGPLSVETVYDQLGLIPDETADQILLATEAGDAKAVMSLLEEAIRRGRDPRAIIESLLQRVADLTRSAYGVDALEDATRGAALHETAARIGRDRLLFLRSHLAEVHRDVRDVSLPRVWMESALLQLTQSQSRPAGAAAERPDEVLKRAEPAPKATEAAGNGTKPAEKTPAARPSPPRPSGDPKLDESRAVWTKMLEAISGGERPPAIALRLQQSEVVAVKGPELTVELRGQFHVDWMRDNLQRQGFVVKELKAVSGNDYKVVYRASARAAVDAEPEAVELPAEGPRLEKLAREILGSA